MSNLSYDHEEDVLLEEVEVIDKSELIVFNDDFNTFDWVIKCFMEVCIIPLSNRSNSRSLFILKEKQQSRLALIQS